MLLQESLISALSTALSSASSTASASVSTLSTEPLIGTVSASTLSTEPLSGTVSASRTSDLTTPSTSDTPSASASATLTIDENAQQKVIIGIPLSRSKLFIFNLETMIEPMIVEDKQMIPDPDTQVIAIGSIVYFICGEDKSLTCYNLETSTWRRLAPARFAGYNRALSFMGGYIYSVGGYLLHKDGERRSTSAARYSIPEDRWEELPDQPGVRAAGRSSCSASNKLIVSGGHDGSRALYSIDEFHVTSKSWQHLGDMMTPRTCHFTCVYQEKMYIFGGYSKSKPFIEVFDLETRQNSIVKDSYLTRNTKWFDKLTTRLDEEHVIIYNAHCKNGLYTDDVVVYNVRTNDVTKKTIKGLKAAKIYMICAASLKM